MQKQMHSRVMQMYAIHSSRRATKIRQLFLLHGSSLIYWMAHADMVFSKQAELKFTGTCTYTEKHSTEQTMQTCSEVFELLAFHLRSFASSLRVIFTLFLLLVDSLTE